MNSGAIQQARLLRERGQNEAAFRMLGELLRTQPHDADLCRELAHVCLALGRKDAARRLIRRAALLREAAESTEAHPPNADSGVVDHTDPDAQYARAIESEIVSEAHEFSETDHDPVPSRNDEERSSAALQEVAGTTLATRTELDASDHRGSEEQSSYEQPESLAAVTTPHSRDEFELGSEPECTELVGTPSEQEALANPIQTALSPGEFAIADELNETETADEANTLATRPDFWESEDDCEQSSLHDLFLTGDSNLATSDVEEFDDLEDEGLSTSDDLMQHEGEFDWAEVDATFDDETEEWALDAQVRSELSTLNLQKSVDVFRWAEQKALDLLRKLGRLDEGRHASDDLQTLARLFLEGAANARRAELSVSVRARHIGELLVSGVSLEDVVSAHVCREVWAENPEFHVDLGKSVLGEAWMRSDTARASLSWKVALDVVETFGAREREELCRIFFEMYERWVSSGPLQRQFPAFRRYVQYRLIPTGCLLDELPFCVFDEPDDSNYVDRWEDDAVRAPALKRELQQTGLIPEVGRCALDLPSASVPTPAR